MDKSIFQSRMIKLVSMFLFFALFLVGMAYGQRDQLPVAEVSWKSSVSSPLDSLLMDRNGSSENPDFRSFLISPVAQDSQLMSMGAIHFSRNEHSSPVLGMRLRKRDN